MANNGWIKLHRSIIDWEWWGDDMTCRFFIGILCLCNYEKKSWMGKSIEEGSFVTSLDKLSARLNMKKITVRRCLEKLEETGEIKTQNLNKLGIKITVIKYRDYQNEHVNEHVNEHENEHESEHTNEHQLKKERKKKKRTLPSARPGEDPSFNSAINMTAEQRLDSLSRWSRILNVWKSNEADYILKNACEKYWMKYSQPLQEEIVQYVESLGPKSVHLSNLWISTLMKNRLLHPGQIAIEIEKAEKFVKPEKKAPLNHRNNINRF